MHRVDIGGMELEYEMCGHGEPVLLIHPGIFARWFTPLARETVLTSRYRAVRYHRAGCAGSSRLVPPVTLATHAAHARALMRALDIRRAHVVGHSSSANLALQLALDAPEAVQSLALLEPALYSVPNVAASRAFVAAAAERYRAGDRAEAIDTFLRGVCGPGYREVLDRKLPGAFAQHVADASTFFEQELPALRQWSFTQRDAARIRRPVLAVVTTGSLELDVIWRERHDLLLAWLPGAESMVLPNATHLLMENTRGLAEGLRDFLVRHPIPRSAG